MSKKSRENKINRRDKKRRKKKHGMRISGNSVKLLHKLIMEKANKANDK